MKNIDCIIPQPDNVTTVKITSLGQKTNYQNTQKKRTSIERIVYSFENKKIISFQDNFKNLGDVLFTVYFDIQTTTVHDIFEDPKIFVINYCHIHAFHPYQT